MSLTRLQGEDIFSSAGLFFPSFCPSSRTNPYSHEVFIPGDIAVNTSLLRYLSAVLSDFFAIDV